MQCVGKFRVYFNRHGAAPLVWCVATDEWELAVAVVDLRAPASTVYRPKSTPDADDGKPSAWIEVEGLLEITASCATIRSRFSRD